MLDELDALLTRMAENPAIFGDGEGVQALHRSLARLDAVTTVATAAFDASGEWEAEGAGSAAAWMAVRCTMPKNHAWRRVHLGRALRHLPGAEQAWLVFDSPARVIDVGAARRLFEGATRRAVQVRDQECFHPFCDRPAEQCQIDHVEPYAAGGRTVTTNGRPACTFHNLERHRKRKRRPPTKE